MIQLKGDDVLLRVFEEYVLTGADVGQFPAQNQFASIQLAGGGGLPQHQKGLYDAALAHAVYAAQHGERGARQIQCIETLEVSQHHSLKHKDTSRSVPESSETVFVHGRDRR